MINHNETNFSYLDNYFFYVPTARYLPRCYINTINNCITIKNIDEYTDELLYRWYLKLDIIGIPNFLNKTSISFNDLADIKKKFIINNVLKWYKNNQFICIPKPLVYYGIFKLLQFEEKDLVFGSLQYAENCRHGFPILNNLLKKKKFNSNIKNKVLFKNRMNKDGLINLVKSKIKKIPNITLNNNVKENKNLLEKLRILSNCEAGKYIDGATCKSCPRGTYSDVANVEASINIEVGSSTSNAKSIELQVHQCPTTVNKNNWLGGYTYDDTFSVTVVNSVIIVKRTDKIEGWGMNLRFQCTMYCKICPSGRYGSTTGLKTNQCTGLCPAGRYGIGGSINNQCTGECQGSNEGAISCPIVVSDKDGLINAVKNANSDTSNVHEITITTTLIQFTGAMKDDSAIYLENAKVNIIGPTNKVELRGQGSSGKYRIFYLNGGTYHLENLKITNGYVSILYYFIIYLIITYLYSCDF